jgi:hypothetical protein
MFCPNCGANVADGSTVCPQCGKPINAPQVPSFAAAPAGPAAYPPGAYGQPRPDAKTDGKATASLVLGILSFFCLSVLTGIPAIILGHMSRSNIRKSMGRLKGDGMALVGLILGYLSVAFVVPILIIAAIAIPNFIRARISANEASAASTVRTLVTAEISYQANNPKVGYAADIVTLGSDAGSIAENCNNGVCTKSGYQFMIQADEQEPHQLYVITATPTEAGRTGSKNFCSTNDGLVRYERITSKRPMAYTAEECAALTPIGE